MKHGGQLGKGLPVLADEPEATLDDCLGRGVEREKCRSSGLDNGPSDRYQYIVWPMGSS